MVKSLKCINIHPGYNPINRGWYPQVFAIVNGSYIGATIHEIDIYLDHGNIIDRDFIKIESWYTSLSLYIKINELEISLLKKNLINIVSNSYSILVPESEGKLYLKKDFDKLCQLDLNKQQTVQETINLLRALTHGEYKNAYYIDEVTGKKIYVSIELGEN
jgi:methionyl-tRNA formyltransferase